MKRSIFFIFLISLSIPALAQEIKPFVLEAKVLGGDTIPVVRLREVEIYTLDIPKTKRGRKKLTKLVKNIKVVYPYAKTAGAKLAYYEVQLRNAKNDRERRKIMKQAEVEIKEEYGEELKELTFKQGTILIKLLDRETGNTSYALVQDLRGKFTAFWYQAFARMWGYNLKVKYDSEGADKQIEIIVKMIERGQI